MEAVQTTLDTLLSRFDSMAADVKTVNDDVRSLRQQMQDFGEDLDGVKRRFTAHDKGPAKPAAGDVASSSGLATHGAVLTNNGPPLLDKLPPHGQVFYTAPSSPQGGDDYYKRPPRHDFPRFSGEKPILWFDMCLTYFDLFKTSPHQWWPTMGVSSRIVRELTNRHLQSVVSLTIQWKNCSQEGRAPIACSATGFILHACSDFISILTCSHTFKPFVVCHGPAFDTVEIINDNTKLQVGFFDGFEASGEAYCIDWWKDLCLVMVTFPEKSSYAPVRFIDDEEDTMGQSVYSRGTKVYSIFCFPTEQQDNKLLFGTTVKGDICGRNNLIGNDLDPLYHSDLRFFEFHMAGVGGCSGAPIFSKDLLVMGMRIAKCGDLSFALKLDQIRQWAFTWFDTKRARSMNDIVAKAIDCMSREKRNIRELQSADFELPSIECNIDDVDL